VLRCFLSVLAWLYAPALGLLMAGGGNHSIPLTFAQLLKAMFLGLGLCFCLDSIGDLLNSLHFLFVAKLSPETIPDGMRLSPYDISKSILNFSPGSSWSSPRPIGCAG
jgi:hypothetical protein